MATRISFWYVHETIDPGPNLGAQVIFRIIECLIAAGAVVSCSGDGLGAYSSSSNIITNYALNAAGSINNPNAWLLLRELSGLYDVLFVRGLEPDRWRVAITSDVGAHTGGSAREPTSLTGQNICVDYDVASFLLSERQHLFVTTAATAPTNTVFALRAAKNMGATTTAGMFMFGVTPTVFSTQDRIRFTLALQAKASIDRNRMRRVYGSSRSVSRSGIVA